ncbi:MAG: molybdenum ABC transporter ATP-binding protein [Proteobacteria bacterium]|nr:molybdenum ABC transporter ATP-binding protein [Pseudomonadota bacterium]
MSIQAQFKYQQTDFLLDVDIKLPDVGISVIYGPSGCGKTTLLRLIAGLDRAESGCLRLGNTVWQDQSSFLPTHRRALGYVFQEASLFPHLSVTANIQYGIKRVGKDPHSLPLDTIIQLLGIGTLLERQPHTLSGGEKQRVAIARALATRPDLLLMDEPLAAIDSTRKQEILPYLQDLRTQLKIPVIYVTHSLDEAAQLADQLVLMDGGRIRANGTVSEMLSRLDLPLSTGVDRSCVINGLVSAIDESFGISYFDFPGGQFTIAGTNLAIGDSVRIQISARDVSLSLEKAKTSSILNIFPATVIETSASDDSQVLVKLAIGQSKLLALISRKSTEALQIQAGVEVYAQIKSAALLN